MKKTILALFSAIVLSGSSLYAKDIKTVTVTTSPEMHCAGCEAKIKNFFKFEKGIKKIETSVPKQRVTIIYDADKTSEQVIINSFSKIKYKVQKVTSDNKADNTMTDTSNQ